MEGALIQGFTFLAAAVIAVPLAVRLGLGSVLGYLIAGIVIGPVLGLVGTTAEHGGDEGMSVTEIQHFAEFGVVMMLFLVGLELEPRHLWAMRHRLIGLGGLQIALTAAAVAAIAFALGQPGTVAVAIGLILALSSTAIVLQTLTEKNLMKSDGGKSAFSVLLTQDIAVIPMLALVPLLAIPELAASLHGAEGHAESFNLTDGLPGWAAALVTLAAIGGVVALGTFITPYAFRVIASTGLREMFTAGALAFVVGIAVLMTLVGLSPALGTFLAGVVLANSEFRHELESDIDPFKGLLLGLFFITVGAGVDFGFLWANLAALLGATLGLIALKALILLALSVVFGIRGADRWLFALGLAQAGEFGFVLISFTVQNAVLPSATGEFLLMVVALSMLLTPALFILYDRVIVPRHISREVREDDEIDEDGVAIIAGNGRFGQISNRVLLGSGFRTVVLDNHPENIRNMARFGVRSFYGDPTRPELLHAAGLMEAKVLVIAVNDPRACTEIARFAKRENPGLHVVARAHDRHHVYELYAAGADDIIRETFDSATRAARCALEGLGMHPYEAEKTIQTFIDTDMHRLRELAGLYDPDIPVMENEPYIKRAGEMLREIEAAMKGETGPRRTLSERAWAPPGMYGEKDEADE